MEQSARVLIFHRNRLFGECLASALTSAGRMEAQHRIHRDGGGMERLMEPGVDAVVVDLSLRTFAIDLAASFRRQTARTKVLLMASSKDHDAVAEAIAAGAHGCILEEATLCELRQSVERLLLGESVCSPELVQSMFARLVEMNRQARPTWRRRAETASLTQREIEVLGLIAEGLSNKQIARRLTVSLYTVKNHVHNILQKLQAPDRFEAVDHMRRRGWLADATL